MKKFMAVVMMAVTMLSMSTNVYAREIGEAEKAEIIKGNYEVVALHKGATLGGWTEPDIFGNRYMLFTYTQGSTEEVVCLKYHLDRAQLRKYRATKK